MAHQIVKTKNLYEFSSHLFPNKRLIGLDLGTTTIGVSLCDNTRTIASAQKVIHRKKLQGDLHELLNLFPREETGGWVIGFPLEMNGQQGKSCHRVLAFADELSRLNQDPILLWDERLTTSQAQNILVKTADISRQRQKGAIDKTSATIILQSALDALKIIC